MKESGRGKQETRFLTNKLKLETGDPGVLLHSWFLVISYSIVKASIPRPGVARVPLDDETDARADMAHITIYHLAAKAVALISGKKYGMYAAKVVQLRVSERLRLQCNS